MNVHYAGGVNNYLNNNHTKNLANSAADFLRFGKFPPHVCGSSGATYRPNNETFSAL